MSRYFHNIEHLYEESPQKPASNKGAKLPGSSYRVSLGDFLSSEMKRTLTADLRPRGFAAATRGDMATAAAFEREYLRRMNWVKDGVLYFHGGRSAFGGEA